MALGTNKIGAVAQPGVTAAATARPLSGGRNVASQSAAAIEALDFTQQIGVNDNAILRREQDMWLGGDGRRRRDEHEGATPFVFRAASSFQVDEVEETMPQSEGGTFLAQVMQGVGAYEANMRVTTPGTVRPGSVLNYLY